MHSISKRAFLTGACCGVAASAAMMATPAAAQVTAKPAPVPKGLSPDEALELLKKGNRAFVEDHPLPAAIDRKRRLELANSQHPFAVLVGCSDSRVSPEYLFGRGLGDLFIVRVAGNTVDQVGLGSIEYAVDHLDVPLIVVLGHEHCGAVSAAVSVVTEGADFDSAMDAMVAPIIPAVLKSQLAAGDLIDNSVKENARRVAESLKKSGPTIIERLAAGTLKIVPAYYSLDDGSVQFLE